MRRTSSLSFVTVLLLAACGGLAVAPTGSASTPPPVIAAAAPPASASASEKAATAPSSPTDAPPASAAAAAPPRTPPVTKLLDAGAAPRRALRYKVKPGWVEWVELDVATALTVTVNGALQPRTTLPTKRVLWKLEAKEVTSEGDVMLGFTVANVELLKGDQVPERSLFSYRWQPFGSTPPESTSSATSGASTRGSASIGTASRRSG